mmetsp:Transcript_31478/g.76548  ORF Transcript_31478/g.76548 Transcript_31478/m.76548 type:complete len:327 (-) Transcript_31478:270-1250(-)
MQAPLLLFVLVAPAVRAPSMLLQCPSWCAEYKCDGSTWCQDGEKPEPCVGCPKERSSAGVKLELTIPPYVGAHSVKEAEEMCKRHGGRLAAGDTAANNREVLGVLLKYKRLWATIAARRSGSGWNWQGHDAAWSYTNWAAGQPDNEHEECVEMWTTGQWNDIPCYGQDLKPYICQVPVPTDDYTFPCSPGLAKKLGHSATCRYLLSAFSPSEKASIHWGVARDQCKAYGPLAQLAEPRTAEQVQFLASAIRKTSSESLWIGLTKKSNGYFWDSDGSKLKADESFWAVTEPNGQPGDCVEMWEDGTWNDRPCDIGKVLSCEQPLDSP